MMQLGKNHLHGQRYRKLFVSKFISLPSNIRRMDPARFAFREHDEIERIEKGKRAFWKAFDMQGKKPIRCEISTSVFFTKWFMYFNKTCWCRPFGHPNWYKLNFI